MICEKKKFEKKECVQQAAFFLSVEESVCMWGTKNEKRKRKVGGWANEGAYLRILANSKFTISQWTLSWIFPGTKEQIDYDLTDMWAQKNNRETVSLL